MRKAGSVDQFNSGITSQTRDVNQEATDGILGVLEPSISDGELSTAMRALGSHIGINAQVPRATIICLLRQQEPTIRDLALDKIKPYMICFGLTGAEIVCLEAKIVMDGSKIIEYTIERTKATPEVVAFYEGFLIGMGSLKAAVQQQE